MPLSNLETAEQMEPLYRALIDRGIYKSCFNCSHGNKEQVMCYRSNIRPPMEVIIFGCPAWDYLPF